MAKKRPDVVDTADVNLTDVNGAPGSMDEDGNLFVEEGDEENSEEDHTPIIQRLTIAVYHPSKTESVQTDIRAMIHVENGLLEKRTVVPGNVTAKRLGAILSGVAAW